MKETNNTNPIEEARRYVANAEEVIKKAKYDPELRCYTDSKYIKAAGDHLWKGCLIALDAVLQVRLRHQQRRALDQICGIDRRRARRYRAEDEGEVVFIFVFANSAVDAAG